MNNVNVHTLQRFWKKTAIFWVLVLLVVLMAFASEAFFTQRNILNVMKQTSITAILGVGMTFVLISGGIDLSVGSVIALAGVLASATAVTERGISLAVTILVAVGMGMLCGLINGVGIAYIGYPPFIMTLGMMTSARGLALVFTNGKPIFGLSPAFVDVANATIFKIPLLVYYLVAVIIVGYVMLTQTVFGRRVYAIGGNAEAARLSGVNVKLQKVLIYMISGTLAGFCGLLMCSRITSGNATVASGYEMNAIASAVIGGVSMNGGAGSVMGTLIGALILTIIQNSFDILGINPFYQSVIQGIIILMAVFMDIRNKQKAA